VPPAELSSIFKPFYRVADARDRASGGVGLGLAIAERVVQAHQGSIRATNRPGGGLEVALSLKCVCVRVIAERS
jgi:two-component system, OmpR family, sensor histidine kinase CpxA